MDSQVDPDQYHTRSVVRADQNIEVEVRHRVDHQEDYNLVDIAIVHFL